MTQTEKIPGYDFGAPHLSPSPVTLDDLRLLKQTLLWTADDDRYLAMAGEVLADQIGSVLDTWYGYVGANPHLVASFAGADGLPDATYLQRVRDRFEQWLRDTTTRPYDQAWLDYQNEIARRHTQLGKNRTDRVTSTTHVPLRSMIGFIYPITATMASFLAAKGHERADVDGMRDAWFKCVVLHVALWAQPYTPDTW